MGERQPIIIGQPELAPVAVIGGTLTTKQVIGLYAPILDGSQDSLPASDRFYPIPWSSLDEPERMVDCYQQKLVALHEQLGQRVVLVGHSLGALITERLALLHPDKVIAAVMLAGAQEGIGRETPTSYALKRGINHPATRHISSHSDFILGHREEVANNWSPEVAHHAISPTLDELFLLPQGLRGTLPEGQTPHRYITAPHIWGVRQLLQVVPGMPRDVELLRSRPTSHYELPRARAVIQHIRDVQAVAAAGENTAVQSHPQLFTGSARYERELRASYGDAVPAAA